MKNTIRLLVTMVVMAAALACFGTAPAEATTYNFTYSLNGSSSDYGSSSIAGTASYSGAHSASVNVSIAAGYVIYDIKWNGTSKFSTSNITHNTDGSSTYNDSYSASVVDNTVVAYIRPSTVTVNAVVASGAPAGAGISPTSNTINYNATTTFTVNPVANYLVSFAGPNGCGGGTFASNTYTTGNVTSGCTVTATYTRVYTISAQTDGSSGSSVSPTSVQIPSTGSQTFTAATTNACYSFNNFSEGGNVLTTGGNYTVSGNSVTVSNPTSNHTVQANFSQNHYSVTENTSAGTTGCSATFNNTPASFASIACGTSGSFTITPSTGCQVASVTQSTGCGLTGPSSGTYSVTPTQNCSVTANLGVQTFTVSSALGAGAPTGASVSASKTNVAYNSIVSFTAPVVSGYTVTFTGTAGGCDAGSTSGPSGGNYTYTTGKITGACTVTALYSAGTNTVTINQVGGTGTVACCGSGCRPDNIWPDNGIASYTVTPPNGQVLSSVSLSPGSFTANTITPTGAACGAITFPMNGTNQTLTVNWGHGATVTQTTYTNGVVDNPAGSGGGTISACPAGSSSNTWPDNSTAQYAITPGSGYALTTVSAGPTGGPYTSMLNPAAGGYTCASPYTFSVGTSAQSITAYFASALTVNPRVWTNGVYSSAGGTVVSCNGSNTWGQNTTASYAVIPASGYTLQWIGVNPATSYTPLNPGGYSCSGISYQFPMGSSNQSLAVSFIPTNSVQIVGSTVGGGDITVGAYNGQSIVSTSFNAGFNTSQTFYFIPPSGKGISSVSFDGNLVTGSVACPNGDFTVSGNSNTNVCTYTVPSVGTTGHTLSVTYDTVYQVTVNTSTSGCNQSSGGGFIGTTAPGATQQVINVVNGKPVSFTVSPNSGFVVNGLDFGGVAEISTPQFTSYTFTSPPIRSNVTAMATFTPFYTVSSQIVSASGTTATGTVTPPTAQVVCGNSSPTFTFTPTAPASISDVSVTIGSSGAQSKGVISSYTFSNVTSNSSVTVTFTQEVFQLSNYSIIPPFVQSPVLPNLLLMIDNSASQYDLQYDATGQCYDNNAYNNTVTYYGYFNKDTYYSYNSASGRFEPIPAGDTMPSSCTFRTPFFCVAMSAGTPVSQGGTRTIASVTLSDGKVVNGFIARGNFINYLVTSKFDLQKMILTGGKFDVPSNSLVAESRGCMGKRFVKILSSTQGENSVEYVSNLTFVVRGPNASDPDYVNPVVQNGTSRIDIYDGPYNITSCTGAFTDSSKIDTCLAAPVGGTNYKANGVIHALHVCVKGAANGNMNSLEKDCTDDWSTNYGSVSATVAATLITNDQGGDAICSSVLKHSLINGRDTGYIGLCYDGSKWDGTCESNQMADFCGQMQAQQVVDPTSTTATSGSNYLPSFVIDAGVNALGPAVADYLAKAYQQQAPTGLIQEFQNYIGFGVLAFNYDGAGTECNDGITNTSSPIPCTKVCSDTGKACFINSDCASNSCNVVVKTDGGKIPAGGYIGDPIGDHSTGLINVIDNLQGTSWTPFAETFYEGLAYLTNSTNFSLADTKPTRLQTNDFDATKPPPSASCYLNNVLIITDGSSTADQNAHVNTLASNSTLNPTGSRYASFCSNFKGSTNVAALASMAYNRNIWDLTKVADHSINNEYVTTYVTYSGPDSSSTSACDPKNLMLNTANYGSGGKVPMYWATDYQSMVSNMRDAFKKIATSSASGTAASILNNSQGSGANLLQAVFFPKKVFSYLASDNKTELQDVTSWIGELQNLWFYVDPYLGNSTVREDTNQDYKLSLTDDNVVSFGYSQNQATVTLLKDVFGNGTSLVTQSSDASLDTLKSLWKAGRKLWDRNLSTDPRQIYTLLGTANSDGVVIGSGVDSVNGSPFTRFISGGTFTNNATAQSYMQVSSQGEANTLVDYISGIDPVLADGSTPDPSWRSRKVTIKPCLWTDAEGCKREWKLGDIVSSTPKLDSNLALNTYAASWPQGFNDSSYSLFTGSQNYLNRGMVFVGGNDGMLHAFRLGVLDVSNQFTTTGAIDNTKKAQMLYNGSLATYPSAGSLGSDLGREEWAYIPMNALPYLRYLGDPNYIHIYYVDNTVSLFDASIGVSSTSSSACSSTNYEQCQKMTTLDSGNLDMDKTSWRTVLIGGMGLGGASRDQTATCTDNVATGTCVKTPVSGIGYSSYFALDVTNPSIAPGSSDQGAVKPLWEFNAGGNLGYSLTGPAVVRIGVAGDTRATKNGKWFAVFGSGPTGPIESTTHTFYGKSDQNLTLFVVDIGTGQVAAKINTGVPYAFAGTLTTAVIDTDRNYSDDAFYVGYVQADSTQTNWNQGGVLRVLTHQDPNPNNWTVTKMMTGTGPVTTSVTKLQDTSARWKANGTGAVGKLWVYFGSGRFFYKNDMASVSGPFRIYGVTDPCYSMNSGSPDFIPTGTSNAFSSTCSDSNVISGVSTLQNQTGDASTAPASTLTSGKQGWYINLATSENVIQNNSTITYNAERVITNPNANTNGTVFFSTLMPTADPCGVGGQTYIWAFKYDTGAQPLAATMKGSILLQVSTGDLKQIQLSTAFQNPTNQGYNMRRLSSPISGVPPTGSGMVGMNRPGPTKKLLHIQEK
ncbi:hypothetical protein L4X63_19090 [Geomonas sp. Red32]|uniref:hypothetical protein n=1 Tax=Geomonas sp. Red32 TaxID=2912856 RepID=UPI00202D0973|nr:hypothetical protein [Geomonas sp. Red32]MCM0083697.1 hypothetical protein [Geomonas sp. Red32]